MQPRGSEVKGKVVIRGRCIVKGEAVGEALVTKQPFMFPHGINPETGEIIDKRHELFGLNMKGKIFVFPYGKGSTTGSTWILETIRCGSAPAAMVNLETEPVIATGVILGELLYGVRIPVMDHPDTDIFQKIETGDHVKIDAYKGTIEVYK